MKKLDPSPISDSDFRWKMRMRSGKGSPFFEPASGSSPIQQERLRWLETNPDRYLVISPGAVPLLHDCLGSAGIPRHEWHGDPAGDGQTLARLWEDDFLLLCGGTYRLVGGCVCLPSSWDLGSSIGLTLTEIHHRVPGLNETIGDPIARFLEKLPAGETFHRENWSLTRSGERNYHPDLERPAIDPSSTLEELHFRIEHQAFRKMPYGVVMGIRIEPVPLTDLAEDFEFLRHLHRQLRTMPDAVARYKKLADGIPRVLELLEGLVGKPFPE